MSIPQSYSYSEVLKVLASLFGAEDAGALAKLKARVRKLQAEGLPFGKRPGRGEVSVYSLDQLIQIVLYLELAELGLAPSLVAAIATDMGIKYPKTDKKPVLLAVLDCIKHNMNDMNNKMLFETEYLQVSLSAMSESWNKKTGHISYMMGNFSNINELTGISNERRILMLGLKQIALNLKEAVSNVDDTKT